MLEQGYITPAEYAGRASATALPTRRRHQAADRAARRPRTSRRWVTQQLVDQLRRARRAFERRPEGHDHARPRPPGRRPSRRSSRYLANPAGPLGALVAIDNKTGEVRAMVGGRDYATQPVQPRHPGPAPAGLGVQAVHARRGAETGIGPDSALDVAPSARSSSPSGGEKLHRQQLRGRVRGHASRWPTRRRLGQLRVRRGGHQGRDEQDRALAERMGIRTPVSHNSPMTLGGLKQGVTPLDMAHAYETFAERRQADQRHARRAGRQTARSGSTRRDATGRGGRSATQTRVTTRQVLDARSPTRRSRIMPTVVTQRHRHAAPRSPGVRRRQDRHDRELRRRLVRRLQPSSYTVAVWVGYPDKLKPMQTEFDGGAGRRRHLSRR